MAEQTVPKARNEHAKLSLGATVRQAKAEFAELVGREPEGVSAVEQIEGGWKLAVEVVELDRIPPSTSVMASYELIVDEDGGIKAYWRARRYHRSQADPA